MFQIVKLTFTEIASPISSEDYAITSLKSLMNDLSHQIDHLTLRIATLATEAQSAMKTLNRPLALRALRSKKIAESTLVHRLESLSTLEGIYGKIEQASDQLEFVHAIKTNTGVLRNLNAQVGKMDQVEDMVEELRNEMKTVEDVGKIVEQVGHNNAVNDDDIDEELEALMQDFQSEKETHKVLETQKKLAGINGVSTAAVDERLQSKNVPNAENTSDILPGEIENSSVAASTEAFSRMSVENGKYAPPGRGLSPNKSSQLISSVVSS